MTDTNLLLWIILLPLLGAATNGFITLRGLKVSRKTVGTIASIASIGAFTISVWAFLTLKGLSVKAQQVPQLYDHVFTWINSAPFRVDFALRLDPLSAVMALVITGVGSLIHIYSMGYMAEDPDYPRKNSYLNLFM